MKQEAGGIRVILYEEWFKKNNFQIFLIWHEIFCGSGNNFTISLEDQVFVPVWATIFPGSDAEAMEIDFRVELNLKTSLFFVIFRVP